VSRVAVTLREWETMRPDRGSLLAEHSLSDVSRQLADRLTELGCIEVLELARGIELRATQFVGRVTLDEMTITVHPKLSGAPFLNLLRYAYGLRHLDLYQPVSYASEKWAFQDLLVQQLVAEVTELLARGVHRDYERTRAELSNPSGRIDFRRLVAMRGHSKAVLPCVHYPRTEDTLLNQVVLAGLVVAARLTTDIDLRAHLYRLIKILNPAVSFKRLNTTMLNDAQQTIDRRTTAYEATLLVIELLLRAEGVSLDGETHTLRLPGFLFDMNRFFEALISRYLHDHLEGCEVQDQYHLKELFYYDSDRNPRRRRAPVQKPDFVIRRNRNVEAILDAKYRDLWEKPLPREMLYQLALYALGQNRRDRTAVIVYPTTATDASEQVIHLREPVSGVSHAQVILRPLNLLELEQLLRNSDWNAEKRKVALAKQLAFGNEHTHPEETISY
jgi:5-methylcytosine-specific restriction enzyme subunit McrC